jgi:hypothetical protein
VGGDEHEAEAEEEDEEGGEEGGLGAGRRLTVWGRREGWREG